MNLQLPLRFKGSGSAPLRSDRRGKSGATCERKGCVCVTETHNAQGYRTCDTLDGGDVPICFTLLLNSQLKGAPKNKKISS